MLDKLDCPQASRHTAKTSENRMGGEYSLPRPAVEPTYARHRRAAQGC